MQKMAKISANWLRQCMVLATFGLLLALNGAAHATADGPDYYRLRDGAVSTPLRADPGAHVVVGYLPLGATCIRNMGCTGSDLSSRPRWCKVEHQGKVGWVDGKFLAEGACANPPLNFSGVVHGGETETYRVQAKAGQTLTVTLVAEHPQIYFNVTPEGSQEAMFIGSTSGATMRRRIAADGDYRVDVYLMRAAVRRGASGTFSLSAGITGPAMEALPAGSDALVQGTPFHATAQIPCSLPLQPTVTTCDAGVIRRSRDGTATVQIRWPQGLHHFLFIKGALAASDFAQPIKTSRQGDRTLLHVGNDIKFEIPDPLLTGG